MKKLLLTLLVVGVVWGCVREWEYWDGEDEEELTVDDARSYFEENAEVLSLMEQFAGKDGASGTRSTDMPSIVLTPNWKEATQYHGKKVVIVDVPLLSNVRQSAFRQDKKGKSKSQNYEVPDIETRLMIVDTKRNDEPVRMVTATMIPDLEGVKKAPRETRFLHPRNDFSGIVVLSDLDGVAFNVLELSRGKIVERLGIYSNIAQLEYRENYTILYPRTGLKTHATRLSAGAESANCPDCEAGLCFVHWFARTDKAVVIGKRSPEPPVPGYLCPGCGNSTCYGECEEEIFGPPSVGSGSGVAPSPAPSNDGTPDGDDDDFPDKKPKDPTDDCSGMYDHKIAANDLDESLLGLGSSSQTAVDGNGNTIKKDFPGIDSFLTAVQNDKKNEHSFVMLNMDGDYYGSPSGVLNGSATGVNISENPFMAATIHNHPVDLNMGKAMPPSPLDLVLTVSQAINYPKFEGSFVYCDSGEMYCLKVTMTDQQRTALKNQQIFKDYDAYVKASIGGNNAFISGTKISEQYEDAFKQFRKLGFENAVCHALSYVAEKNGWGVTVMRKKAGEKKFSSKHVKKDADGTYSPAECK